MYRAHHIISLRQLHRALRQGNAEVQHLDRAIRFDNDVLRFDITVNDAAAMSFTGRCSQLLHNINRFFGEQSPALLNHFLQRLAGDIFHNDVVMSFILTDIIDFNNIRVGQCCCGLSFPFKTQYGYCIRAQFTAQDLDCYLPVQNRIDRKENIRHATLADVLEYFITICDEIICHRSHLLPSQSESQ